MSTSKGKSNSTAPTYNSTASSSQMPATGSGPAILEIEAAAVLIVLAAAGYVYASKKKKIS